jgi:hypothetical protein
MKLTKSQIQFIDNYLENSDVIYIDLRYEMIDHIATGVEEMMDKDKIDFYDAFKNYMVIHKKSILKNNKSRYSYSWLSIKQFLLFLAKPFQLLIALLLFIFYKNIDIHVYFSKDFTVNNLFFIIIFSLMVVQVVYFHYLFKKKLYCIESVAVILNIIYLFHIFFFPFYGKKNISEITLTIFTYLLLGYVFYFFQQLSKYKKQYFNLIK